MNVTKGQVDAAIEIIKLSIAARKLALSPKEILNISMAAAVLVSDRPKDAAAISNAVINQMITIRAEVK